MGEFFGNLRAAVQATKAYPEQVDAVVWLMAQREVLPEERFYVEQHLSQVRCGSFTLFELVTWLLDGLSGLRAMFDLHQDVFLPHDSDEWLASFAWLIVMVEGDCRKMVGREHDQNWLCRSRRGTQHWAGVGLKDTGAMCLFKGAHHKYVAIKVATGADGFYHEDELYRTCYTGDVAWPGLPKHLGFEPQWDDCYFSAVEEDYDDDYE